MKSTLSELKGMSIDKLFVESVDLSIYIARALVNGEERLIATDDGQLLKRRNLLEMKEALASLTAAETVLCHRSAYDEMVGHAHGGKESYMELPLSLGIEDLAPQKR